MRGFLKLEIKGVAYDLAIEYDMMTFDKDKINFYGFKSMPAHPSVNKNYLSAGDAALHTFTVNEMLDFKTC